MARLQGIEPPHAEAALSDDGTHRQAWVDYHQGVADRLRRLHLGVADGSAATAGDVGEYLETVVAAPGVALAAGPSWAAAQVASLALTAGDWDVWGDVWFSVGAAGGVIALQAMISGTVGVPPAPGNGETRTDQSFTMPANSLQIIPVAPARLLLSAPLTIYLIGRAVFSAGSHTAYGRIAARRAR